MDELEELAETAGAVTVCRIIQKRPAIESATILGEGKIEELSAAAKDLDAQLIIFDMELSSSQIRNIEDITSVRVIDRTMLILDTVSYTHLDVYKRQPQKNAVSV